MFKTNRRVREIIKSLLTIVDHTKGELKTSIDQLRLGNAETIITNFKEHDTGKPILSKDIKFARDVVFLLSPLFEGGDFSLKRLFEKEKELLYDLYKEYYPFEWAFHSFEGGLLFHDIVSLSDPDDSYVYCGVENIIDLSKDKISIEALVICDYEFDGRYDAKYMKKFVKKAKEQNFFTDIEEKLNTITLKHSKVIEYDITKQHGLVDWIKNALDIVTDIEERQQAIKKVFFAMEDYRYDLKHGE
jgi:hypothetical protein